MTLEKQQGASSMLLQTSFVHHFIAIIEFKLELQSERAQFGPKSAIFYPIDIEIWWMTVKNNRTPFRYNVKLCASFESHRWIQNLVTVRKRPIRVKICHFFVPCDLEIWRMTLKTCWSRPTSTQNGVTCYISHTTSKTLAYLIWKMDNHIYRCFLTMISLSICQFAWLIIFLPTKVSECWIAL